MEEWTRLVVVIICGNCWLKLVVVVVMEGSLEITVKIKYVVAVERVKGGVMVERVDPNLKMET